MLNRVTSRIQLSGAKFDEVGLICGSSPSVRGSHTGSEHSAVVHGWISTCDVAEELETCGTDGVCVSGGGGPFRLKCGPSLQ